MRSQLSVWRETCEWKPGAVCAHNVTFTSKTGALQSSIWISTQRTVNQTTRRCGAGGGERRHLRWRCTASASPRNTTKPAEGSRQNEQSSFNCVQECGAQVWGWHGRRTRLNERLKGDARLSPHSSALEGLSGAGRPTHSMSECESVFFLEGQKNTRKQMVIHTDRRVTGQRLARCGLARNRGRAITFALASSARGKAATRVWGWGAGGWPQAFFVPS